MTNNILDKDIPVNKKCIIVDLDGTLADCSHRQHHVQSGKKKDWKSFFNEMDVDPVNENLNELLKVLHQYYDIYFVTARPSNYYGKTVRWLYEQAGWPKDSYEIIMRNAGDFRSDTVVKQEILNKIRENDNVPIIVFDDRKSVVDMWRENGLLCAQVADHDF
jgi:5'(3')-deoxyribonucleotidase